ncbi:MAG: amidohydrolase family protein [Spirochaetia bacterium]
MSGEKLFIFDNNVTVGRMKREYIEPYTPEGILAVMDRFGIDKALCTHTLSEDTSIRRGEELLFRITEPYRDRLEIKPVTNPLMESTDELLERMEQAGARCIKIFTEKFGIAWIDEVFGGLFGICNERRIPVWVDENQVDWRGLSETLASYPDLPVIVGNSRYNFFNMMTIMMRKFPNLYFDVSRFNIFDGYRVIKETVGCRRLLFGSALPKYSPGAPLTFLRNAGITDDEISGILGGNLGGLLERVLLPGGNSQEDKKK